MKCKDCHLLEELAVRFAVWFNRITSGKEEG